MAIRPSADPKWVASSHGNDEIAWQEAKRQCRRLLHEWCARKEPHAYRDLIAKVTAIPWPPGNHSSGQLGYLLGQVSWAELDATEDRPIISSVVIASGKNEPSNGFWAFVENDLGIRVPSVNREDFWLIEMNRCFEVYGSESNTD
jgi:hypothetical protein